MPRRTIAILLAFLLPLLLTLPATAKTQEDPRIELLNSAELEPTGPGSDELDAYLDNLMADIFLGLLPEDVSDKGDEAVDEALEGLTTCEKTVACYNYVMDTVTYGSHLAYLDTPLGDTTCRAIYRKYGDVEGFGAVALTAGKGMCNAYASAFLLMARKIGLTGELVAGYTVSRGGSYAFHEWAEITIDETVYVFDPQLDQSYRRQGLGSYDNFCRTYEQIKGRYAKE
jgi:hypothetical protein